MKFPKISRRNDRSLPDTIFLPSIHAVTASNSKTEPLHLIPLWNWGYNSWLCKYIKIILNKSQCNLGSWGINLLFIYFCEYIFNREKETNNSCWIFVIMFMLSRNFCCYSDFKHSLTMHVLAVHFNGTEKNPVWAINMTSPSRFSFIWKTETTPPAMWFAEIQPIWQSYHWGALTTGLKVIPTSQDIPADILPGGSNLCREAA